MACFFDRTLSDMAIKLLPESSLCRTLGMVNTSVIDRQYALSEQSEMEEYLPQMVRVITRHSVNGSGVSIPEQGGYQISRWAVGQTMIHLTKDICRYIVGYVLQLNPVTVPYVSTNPSRGP